MDIADEIIIISFPMKDGIKSIKICLEGALVVAIPERNEEDEEG